MRARRSDYVQLHQPPDVPYASFDNRLQTKGKHSDRNILNPLEESPESELESNSGGAVRHIERSPSGTVGKLPISYRNIRASGLERNREGGENQFGASERVFSSGEWNFSAVREQFKFAGATERTSLCAAGEHVVSPSLEQRFIKSGLWPPASAGDVGIITGIGPSGSSSPLKQTSGGSFIDSGMSSDFAVSTLSPTVSFSTIDSSHIGAYREASNEDGTQMIRSHDFSAQSWAQQTEQSYNLQMALALRLVATADLTEEPLLYANAKENRLSISAARSSAAATAHRFWVNGSLGYSDKIQDGFYHIWGINPHIWAICNDTREGGMLPSLDVLQQVDPSDTSMEVVLFDKHGDSHLRDLEQQVLQLAYKAASLNELAESLGELVCSLMGGAASSEDADLVSRWRATSSLLKDCVSCLVIPVGSLSVGLCRHRALLYKALADSVELPCRITRGCKYCGLHDGASCLVLCGNEREWLVDLIANPGDLSSAESFLKNSQSPPICSPLRLPDLKASEIAIEVDLGLQVSAVTQIGAKGKQSMLDKLGATPAFNGPVSTRLGSGMSFIAPVGECKSSSLKVTRPDNKMSYEIMPIEGRNLSCHLGPLVAPATSDKSMLNKDLLCDILISVKTDRTDFRNLSEATALQVQDLSDSGKSLVDSSRGDMELTEKEVECQAGNIKKAPNLDLSLALDGFEIPWADLVLRERIGAGSFGTVHRADWHGSDVAVKILIDQDFQDERLQEFVREVALMKRMRHPNIVLFMGAVTKRPNFSIVTEYLPRGSLFRLLHRAGVREMLDEKRRIRMAIDVAKGMNYLHRMNPPIVHRDLKSPNLLVDKTWTVKVCDFGLSRFKGNTFLSSRSAAGTPEWMAPEVLRDEPSNEKADVYSFGIILWELATLQQPWNGLGPAQVVGAVGFQNRRLHIPKDVNPEIAALIEACFSDDPQQRPSFASIMESLKNIQKISVTAGGATNS